MAKLPAAAEKLSITLWRNCDVTSFWLALVYAEGTVVRRKAYLLVPLEVVTGEPEEGALSTIASCKEESPAPPPIPASMVVYSERPGLLITVGTPPVYV